MGDKGGMSFQFLSEDVTSYVGTERVQMRCIYSEATVLQKCNYDKKSNRRRKVERGRIMS